MRSIRWTILFSVVGFFLMYSGGLRQASAQSASAPQGSTQTSPKPIATTGFALKKPVFGGACPTCPWGAMGEIVREALKPYGWDIQICYSCAGGARAARLMAAAVIAPPPATPTPDSPPTPNGVIDFGATGTQLAWWAYQGTNAFANDPEGPRKNLRLIANIQQPAFFGVAVG